LDTAIKHTADNFESCAERSDFPSGHAAPNAIAAGIDAHNARNNSMIRMQLLACCVAASLVFSCAKTPEPTSEPTYLNRRMSAWADQAADVDLATSFEGLAALAHFDIATGTQHAVAVLKAICKDQ